MRTAGGAPLALVVTAVLWVGACVPGQSASPERQANSRIGDGNVLEGPLENAVTERFEAREREKAGVAARYQAERELATSVDEERYAASGAATVVSTWPEATTALASAWDLRLLDVLAIQLDVTGQLAAAVAERGGSEALRAWAEEEVVNTARWRQELGDLRQEWYGDARPPLLEAAPGLKDLGPVTQRLAARWNRGHQYSGEYREAREITPAEEYARGVAPVVPPADPALEEEEPIATVATESLVRLGGTVIPASVATDAIAPLLRRGIAAGTAGTMQASREELRALALRIQLGEQRSLARLAAITSGRRG